MNWTLRLIFALKTCLILPIFPLFALANSYLPITCSAPVSLQAINPTTTSIELTWSSVNSPAETAWDLEILPFDQPFSGNPTVDSLTSLPFLVGGLAPGVQYKFKVRAHCSVGGGVSAWSTTRLFRTHLTNPSPCAMNLPLADTTCAPFTNHFLIENSTSLGSALGTDVALRSVRFIVAHAWDSDLEFRLVSPSGVSVLLAAQVGGSGDNFGNPLDATCRQVCELNAFCATTPINSAQAVAPFVGQFLPEGNFSDFNDGSSPNGLWRLEICDLTADDLGNLKFVELVFASLTCQPPTSVATTLLSSNSVALTWQNPSPCADSLLIEYGPSGFTPGSGATAGVGGFLKKVPCSEPQPYVLTNLTPLTSYDVFIRKQCPPAQFSINSCKKTFFTDCISPSLVENFDAQNECGTACSGLLPSCPLVGFWQNATNDDWDFRTHAGSTPTSNTGPDDDVTGGGKYIYTEVSCGFIGNITGKKAILRSRCALIHANGSCSMSFNWHLFGANIGSLKLEISTDAGQNWIQLFQKSGNQGNAWHREFVDLTAFDGLIAQFRFVATAGNGTAGDLALDEIRFFGSTDAGAPDYVFYKDNDGDGFGNAAISVASCSPIVPPGFVVNSGDCNDSNAAINPAVAEIFCNNIDENCNGMADDGAVPAPTIAPVAPICSEKNATVMASTAAHGQFFWYDAPMGGNLLAVGNSLTINQLSQSKTVWLADSIFYASQNHGCASPRTAAQIVVHPSPRLAILESPAICRGESFDLSSLTVIDSANTNGIITWHVGSTASQTNKLASPLVTPSQSTTYTVLSTSPNGCTDEATVLLTVHDLPTATISQGNSLALCRGEQAILTGLAAGNQPPFFFTWTGGSLQNAWNFFTLPINGGTTAGLKTYTLTVRDGFGCLDTAQIQVSTAASISSMQIDSVKNATACGATDGKIKLTPLNGLAPFSFAWDGPTPGSLANRPAGQTTILGLGQGAYQITITDSSPEGCSMVLPAQVINAPGLAVKIDSIFAVKCPSGLDGHIELNLLDGQNPTYVWSNGSTAQDLQNVGAGLFSVTITDGACQQKLKNLQVKQPDSFNFLPNSIENVTCHGAMNGKIDLEISGGTRSLSGPAYQFLWSNGATVEDIGSLAGGAYRTTLTDAAGCTTISNWFTVLEPQPLVVTGDSIHPITCAGGHDGAIFLQANGGNGGYTFAWNTPSGPAPNATSFQTDLAAGLYQVTTTDAKGCAATFLFPLLPPEPLSFYYVETKNPSCVGVDDGEIWVHGIGGQPPYIFHWSQPSGTALPDSSRLVGLASGALSMTLTDARGCPFSTQTVALEAVQVIDFQIDTLADVRCFGEKNGRIVPSISGGTAPFSVVWNGSIFSKNVENATAGNFQAIVTDALGCRFLSQNVEVKSPVGPLAATVLSKEDASCFGLTDGSIDVQITGGTAPFSPVWNDSLHVEDLSNLGLGFFNLKITDAHGCTASLPTVVVGQPSEIEPNATITQIPCLGSGLGSIELAPEGGYPNYSILWNTGDTTTAIYQLMPGFYAATLTDVLGCERELKPIQIYNSNLDFSAQVVDFQPISCFGKNDGQVAVSFNGGTPPFQVAWKSGQLSIVQNQQTNRTNLSKGAIWLTVLDDAGCLAVSDTVVIEEPSKVTGFYEKWLSPPCANEASGLISPKITGGVQPYFFSWTLPNGSILHLDSLKNVGAGSYQLAVEDLNSCPFSLPPLVLTAPGLPISLALDSLRDDNCGNGSGFLQVAASGGVPFYEFNWSNGDIGATIENLTAGIFTVSVTDDSLCTKTFSFEIKAGTNPIEVVANIENVKCWGDSTGWVKVAASGGQPPYSFSWSNGATTDSIFGLPKATYFITVTDAFGCKFTAGALVQQPILAFSIDTILINDATQGQSDGSICVSLQGGNSQSYQFLWSNFEMSNCIFGLPSGLFSLTATDGNGCQIFVDSIAVGEIVAANEPSFFETLRLWPNPVSEKLFIRFETSQAVDFQAVITDLRGQEVAFFEGKNQLVLSVENLAAGVYFLKIKTTDGAATRRFVVVR